MAKKLQFRIRELMAEKERKTGESVTYETINEAAKVSPNTLSRLAKSRSSMVGIGTIERLLDYFDCKVSDLIVYEDTPDQ